MPSWSTRWSFFLIFGFAIYVVARGDGPTWKQIFTQSMTSAATSGQTTVVPSVATTATTSNPLTVGSQALVNTDIAADGTPIDDQSFDVTGLPS